MIEKVKFDDAQRKRVIDKAGHLSCDFGAKYMACAPGIFEGIAEAFRAEGVELFPIETQKALTSGFIGLHGGVAMSGVGTCGAITASTFLISYVVGVTIGLRRHTALPIVLDCAITEFSGLLTSLTPTPG